MVIDRDSEFKDDDGKVRLYFQNETKPYITLVDAQRRFGVGVGTPVRHPFLRRYAANRVYMDGQLVVVEFVAL